ncbi:MAG TPA: TonB-dependent receptor [Terriglobia bacterium]|jgi:outer membrane cobalamin receptor
MRRSCFYSIFIGLIFCSSILLAQSVASGTIEGTVTDPTGGVIIGAMVELQNPVTGFKQMTMTDASGMFRFTNIPFNNYHLQVMQDAFSPAAQDVSVRTAVTVPVKVTMTLAGVSQEVQVQTGTEDILENVPYAHADVDIGTLDKLPTLSPASGLSDAIMLSSPGVVADSNGFFHPLGDHAQTSFSIDGQPISDQQSKAFSTQIPVNAIQNMEIVTGTPNAEYGDKTSLVVNATTRSGLGLMKPTGSVTAEYASFGTPSLETTLGLGGPKTGWFMATNGLRTGRFLDTPEFAPIHAIGNNENTFNRFDYTPDSKDSFHMNVFLARNWFQIPNTYDQIGQDQRQKVVTFDIAPGYQHTFSSTTLLTVNPFVREDRVHYYPSGDVSLDTPATVSQARHLMNWGVRSDISYAAGHHNLKIGTQLMQTRLNEQFDLGITDYTFNPLCTTASGTALPLPNVTNPSQCPPPSIANANFNPALLPLDLTRGGSLFQFAGTGNVNEYAGYVQDAITAKSLTLNLGLRVSRYDAFGTIKDTQAEPRTGLSYLVHRTGTVLRAGYAHTMETPYNENLLVATSPQGAFLITAFSTQGQEGLKPGSRNQYNVGFQQALSRYLQAEGDYFWKYTDNAFDFGVILNTPITFPVAWQKSKLDGVSFRVSSINIGGFQWYTTLGHNRARYFPVDGSVFRIDHDQEFQQTTNVRYQWKKTGPWTSFTWRYDSGLVAGNVPDLASVLALTGAQQLAIGFSCGGVVPAISTPLTSAQCNSSNYSASRVRIPAPGAENDDTNPPRIAPRNILDAGFGIDDLLHRSPERSRLTLRFTISNLTNNVALYNFLSTFSGTHFVAPRTYSAAIGWVF